MFAQANAYIHWKAILQSSHVDSLTSQVTIVSQVALIEQQDYGMWGQANASKLSEVITMKF